jgi:hypothetical protein
VISFARGQATKSGQRLYGEQHRAWTVLLGREFNKGLAAMRGRANVVCSGPYANFTTALGGIPTCTLIPRGFIPAILTLVWSFHA